MNTKEKTTGEVNARNEQDPPRNAVATNVTNLKGGLGMIGVNRVHETISLTGSAVTGSAGTGSASRAT
jgi:hypothetical protein